MPRKARLINGTQAAAELRQSLTRRVSALVEQHGIVPGLAMVLVGDDPASHVYVRNKTKQAKEVGFRAYDTLLPHDATAEQVLGRIAELNADDGVHGIVAQLPLPPQISTEQVLDRIDPSKDADGIHVINAGLLALGRNGVAPATPLGCVKLLKQVHPNFAGMEAVVIGRSNLVGKPLAQILLRENCTVTVAHSRTRNVAGIARRADILVAAVGRPEMVRGRWIKPGATVLDVGINRVKLEGGGSRLVGDVAFAEAVEVAGAISPVPGGVGPMTIACLLQNTLALACTRAGVPVPGG